ncbi:MAG: amidoligase family protein, partial [Schwartzia sp.]|nr:amidoligase family protein [Schwartzia sp. (in: firmicutes)]
SDEYKCEIVTPILQYDDIEDLQNIIRALVKKGAIANESCGIHVHVDGAAHDYKSLTRLVNFAIGRQDLFYEALEIGNRANTWCQKMSKKLLSAMKTTDSRMSMERVWYSPANDGYCGGIDHQHYNSTRYHGINLHAFFTKGTVEFRLFNGTTHAGKIKAYIQFCLAMSAWAVNADDKMYYKSIKGYTQEQKQNLMRRVLKNRLGLKGDEFKTARLHLTSAFNAAESSVAA